MSWRHLESGRVGELPLDLYERDGEYLVRVDGLMLMSSLCHVSEVELASVARRTVSAARPRILLAGLGLGYTLAAFVREYGDAGRLEVVEKSPDVLRWYRRWFRSRLLPGGADARVAFREADVLDHLAGGAGPWDLVVLDVDNGPEPVSGEGNRRLYAREGLAAVRGQLAQGGALLLWSGFCSEPFVERARAAGFQVERFDVPLTRPGLFHHLYVCRATDAAHPGV
jgi:spermidine synthase